MYKGARILAVVPARGGSKGIRLKNLKEIAGKSLIEWVAGFLVECGDPPPIDLSIVSTDHEDIRDEAIKCGISVPFVRPRELAGDCVGDLDVLTHALDTVERLFNKTFDVIVMLQPTSPFRRKHHLFKCLDMLLEQELDSVITVSEVDPKFHPLKQLKVESTKLTYSDVQGKSIIARQQLDKRFVRNGAVYAFSRQCLLEKKEVITMSSGAIICDEPLVNIDTTEDLLFAEFLLQSGLIGKT